MTDFKKIEAVLFDFDMTLVDSSYAIHRCLNLLADHVGLRNVSREEVLENIGLRIEDCYRNFWGEFRQEWLDYYRELFLAEEQSGLIIFPGVVETLTSLRKKNIKVGVASNRHKVNSVLEATKLSEHLDVSLGLSDVENAKPEPDILYKAFDIMKIPYEKGVYVGDTDVDMKTTVTAGIRGIGVTTGNFSAKELKRHGAWKVLDDIRDITSLISL